MKLYFSNMTHREKRRNGSKGNLLTMRKYWKAYITGSKERIHLNDTILDKFESNGVMVRLLILRHFASSHEVKAHPRSHSFSHVFLFFKKYCQQLNRIDLNFSTETEMTKPNRIASTISSKLLLVLFSPFCRENE